jgi:amidase
MNKPSHSFFVPHNLAAPVHDKPGGSLAGLSAAVKDMYDVAGERTGGGSPEWLGAQQPATKHAVAVEKILTAGATIVGKTVCDEFFYSVTGANAHYGTPLNIRAPGRLPGGSSAGSAAATAAGACDFALGSDTGGSIRVPASFCGLYGLRPTHGRVDLSGAMAMSPSFDVAGWFAAAPGVFRKVGTVLLNGSADSTPIERLIFAADMFAEADRQVTELLHLVLARMRGVLPAAEHVMIARGSSGEKLDDWREVFRIRQAFEIWRTYGEFVERARPNFGPGVRERMAFAATVTADAADAAQQQRATISAHICNVVRRGTVLAAPAAPSIAPRTDISEVEMERFRARTFRLTCVAGLAGLPQLVIPAGTVDGCPVGLSFIGWQGADETLLDLAVRLSPLLGEAL